ncbi:hypothetical protein ACFXHD_20465, partial [Streptomyces hydrogenans]
AWDGLWAGAFTRPRSRRDKETVLSYAAKYRAWRQSGGDPAAAGPSFAQLMMLARRDGTAVPGTTPDAAPARTPEKAETPR